MIFDGIKFRRNKNVVVLPREYWQGEQKNYVAFGKVLNPHGKNYNKELVKGTVVETNCKWNNDGTMVMARYIPNKGYSLTNMMHGMDGKIYLAYGGEVYTAPLRKG